MTNFIQNIEIIKYESTPHLEGSKLQQGDSGFNTKRKDVYIPYSHLLGRHIVIEEKLDGGQAGASFSDGAELLLQSRGHYLMGGGRENQFSTLKRWAAAHEHTLLDCLGDQYIMYGETMSKKHAMFYDRLPHIFCEFDIYCRSKKVWLDTDRRAEILRVAPVLPVPVLFRGIAPPTLKDLVSFIRPSLARTAKWRERFEAVVKAEQLDLVKAWGQTDKSDKAEGLYIKIEEDGVVKGRFKFVRSDFTQAILDSDKHHSQQPYIPNQLGVGVDIFAPSLTTRWEDYGLKTQHGW